MNNAHAELTRESTASNVANRKQGNSNEDPIRDFFRRGDRGQYEGGPAERVESLAPCDVPEKAPIIRTPQQQARRRALIRLEVALLSGCVALLVLAARARSIGAANPLHANSTQVQVHAATPIETRAQPAAKPIELRAQPEVPRAAAPEAALPPKPVEAAPPKTNSSAVEALPEPVNVQQAPIAHAKSEATPIEKVAAPTPKKASVPAQASKRDAAMAPRSAPARKVEPVAPAYAATAPKRAVAAFPDE